MTEESSHNDTADAPVDQWYYQLLGLATGPVDTDRVRWLIEHGHLIGASIIGPGQTGPWQRLDESVLAALLPAPAVSDPTAASEPTEPDASTAASPGIESPPADPASRTPMDSTTAPAAPVRTADADSAARPPSQAMHDDRARSEEAELDFADDGDEPVTAAEEDELPVVTPVVHNEAVRTVPEDTAATSKPRRAVTRKRGEPQREKEPLTPRERYSRVAAAVLGLILAVMIFRSVFGGTDGSEAHGTFVMIFESFEKNRESMPDREWVEFVRAAHDRVEQELIPIRAEASADDPELQALMWAGEELLLILRGSRELLPENKTRFESFLAEYKGEPLPNGPPQPESGNTESAVSSKPTDPLFQ